MQNIKDQVRAQYAKVATGEENNCCAPSCCSPSNSKDAKEIAAQLGYTEEQLQSLPENANLGLGCGAPIEKAQIEKGHTVLDLGSGAGIDCFLAADQTGPEGKVIGVDMTPEMLEKARHNAKATQRRNVEFRLGEIEALPVADNSVDRVLSNCVINLSPDKAAVFREVFRALKPGGKLAASDIVLTAPIPEELRDDPVLYSSCISGALPKDQVRRLLEGAGFEDIRIEDKPGSETFIKNWSDQIDPSHYVRSAYLLATKPVQ